MRSFATGNDTAFALHFTILELKRNGGLYSVPTLGTVHVVPGAKLNFLVDGFAGKQNRVRRDGIDHCRNIADVLDFDSSELARLFLAGKEEKDKKD
jgi:hypothetical protein